MRCLGIGLSGNTLIATSTPGLDVMNPPLALTKALNLANRFLRSSTARTPIGF
jgi:hypothetical protein